MTLDTTKLEAALKGTDDAAVKSELSALINRPYTEEEQGEALFSAGMLYTRLMNAVNRNYLDKLLAVKSALDALGLGKEKLGEAVTLAETRAGLAR